MFGLAHAYMLVPVRATSLTGTHSVLEVILTSAASGWMLPSGLTAALYLALAFQAHQEKAL